MYLQVAVPLRALIKPALTRGSSRIVLAKSFLRKWLSILEVRRREWEYKECEDEKSKDAVCRLLWKKNGSGDTFSPRVM